MQRRCASSPFHRRWLYLTQCVRKASGSELGISCQQRRRARWLLDRRLSGAKLRLVHDNDVLHVTSRRPATWAVHASAAAEQSPQHQQCSAWSSCSSSPANAAAGDKWTGPHCNRKTSSVSVVDRPMADSRGGAVGPAVLPIGSNLFLKPPFPA